VATSRGAVLSIPKWSSFGNSFVSERASIAASRALPGDWFAVALPAVHEQYAASDFTVVFVRAVEPGNVPPFEQILIEETRWRLSQREVADLGLIPTPKGSDGLERGPRGSNVTKRPRCHCVAREDVRLRRAISRCSRSIIWAESRRNKRLSMNPGTPNDGCAASS
jgi:hypothetical protein